MLDQYGYEGKDEEAFARDWTACILELLQFCFIFWGLGQIVYGWRKLITHLIYATNLVRY